MTEARLARHFRRDLTCRTCGATPAERGDDVGPLAVAYTCSRCLIAPPRRYTSGTNPEADAAPARQERPPCG